MRSLLLLFLLSLGLAALAQPQGRRITGKVVDAANGNPLPGVTVLIKGTRQGAITKADGSFNYTLQGERAESVTLVVKFLGYQTQEVAVAEQTYLTIQLKPGDLMMDEVVITSSYGTKKLREDVVGAITSLSADDIPTQQAAESVDKMLDGQIAGVQIESNTTIGGPISINIRGQGSLSNLSNAVVGASTQPLIIVDGIILNEEGGIDNQFFDGAGGFSEDFKNPLAQLNPGDIQSISVLKDAAAVGIYGADGANGVIIITTKRGQRGALKVNYSAQLGFSEAINRIQYLSGEQYQALRNEYLENTGGQAVPYNGVNTDWFELLNQRGTFNRQGLTLSGGGKKLRYRVGLNYLGIGEPQVGNSTNQYRVNGSLSYQAGRFQADLSVNQSLFIKASPNIFFSYAFPPTLAPRDDEGNFNLVGVVGLGNPLAAIEQNRNRSESYGTLASLSLRYDILPGWNVSSLFGLDYKDKTQDRYFSGDNESGRRSGTFELDGVQYPQWGRRVINERQSVRWNWQGQTAYEHDWAEKHHFDALAGLELAQEQTDFAYASGAGFVNPGPVNPVEAAIQDDDPATEENDRLANQIYNQDINYNARVSMYAQANYNYRKRYYLLINFRRDQSSVFGDDTDVTYNGGAGVSWVLSQENWLINSNWVHFLRIRLSYGTTGNSRIGSYRSKGLYNFDDVEGYNNQAYAVLNTSAPPNDRLTWETNNKFNLGLDFNFLRRFNLTMDYFRDFLTDLITSRNLPTETGYNSAQINAASMINSGLETSLRIRWTKERAPLQWTTTLNVATLESEVTELVGLGSDFSTSARALSQRIGFSTSTVWGVRWAGVDPATGRDLISIDGQVLDAATYRNRYDNSAWVPLGDRQADHYGGLSNVISWKNFSLGIRGTYQWGTQTLVEDELIGNYRISTNRNLSVNAFDYWRGPGDDQALNAIVINDNPVIPNLSKYVYDLSHFKLSNVNFSYRLNFPENKLRIKTLSLSADVTNVFYWYRFPSPEGRNGIREFRFSYPEARTYSFGANVGF